MPQNKSRSVVRMVRALLPASRESPVREAARALNVLCQTNFAVDDIGGEPVLVCSASPRTDRILSFLQGDGIGQVCRPDKPPVAIRIADLNPSRLHELAAYEGTRKSDLAKALPTLRAYLPSAFGLALEDDGNFIASQPMARSAQAEFAADYGRRMLSRLATAGIIRGGEEPLGDTASRLTLLRVDPAKLEGFVSPAPAHGPMLGDNRRGRGGPTDPRPNA